MKIVEGVELGRKTFDKLSYHLHEFLTNLGVSVSTVNVSNQDGKYVVTAKIKYKNPDSGQLNDGEIKLIEHGGAGVKVQILNSKLSQRTYDDSDDVMNHLEKELRFVNDEQKYKIEFLNINENKKTMKITVKELKEYMKGKPLVVETTTVGKLKSKIAESKMSVGLGDGFKQETVYEIEAIDEVLDEVEAIDEKMPLEEESDDDGRKITKTGGALLGQGFKLDESTLKDLKLTKEGLVDLIEGIVTELKEDNEYKGLKFVDRIGSKYNMNESAINEMKGIIWKENSLDTAKNLHKYIVECACQQTNVDYGNYEGLSEPYQSMMPQIKRSFNKNQGMYPTPKAISITANDMQVPMEMVDELYEIQKDAHKMKLEGAEVNVNETSEKMEACYERYQNIGEGNLTEMYDEMAEMMDYPKDEELEHNYNDELEPNHPYDFKGMGRNLEDYLDDYWEGDEEVEETHSALDNLYLQSDEELLDEFELPEDDMDLDMDIDMLDEDGEDSYPVSRGYGDDDSESSEFDYKKFNIDDNPAMDDIQSKRAYNDFEVEPDGKMGLGQLKFDMGDAPESNDMPEPEEFIEPMGVLDDEEWDAESLNSMDAGMDDINDWIKDQYVDEGVKKK